MVLFNLGSGIMYEPAFRYSSINIAYFGDEKHLFRVNIDNYTIEHYIFVEKKDF